MIAFLGLWRAWLALALIVGAFLAGVKVESDHRDAQQLVLERAQHEQYVKTVGAQRAANVAVSGELAKTRTDTADEIRALKGRIPDAPQLSTCSALQPADHVAGSADPVPVPRFTAVFIRLWDEASYAGLPASDRPGRADAGPGEADPVDARELLENHTDNAGLCNDFRAQIRAWQRWAIENGLAPRK